MRIKDRTIKRAQASRSGVPQAGWVGACVAALGRMGTTLRELGSADRTAEVAAVTPAGPPRPPPAPHLSRLTSVVGAAAQHAERAEQCHRGAGIRIDAALYDLELLRMELQAVVDPALLQGAGKPVQGPAAEPGTGPGEAARPAPASPMAGRAESARPAA